MTKMESSYCRIALTRKFLQRRVAEESSRCFVSQGSTSTMQSRIPNLPKFRREKKDSIKDAYDFLD